MTTQLLLYERATPVTLKKHGDWSVKTGTNYEFARGVNAVPLLLAEFSNAAGHYPIVFTESEDTVMPAAVLGVRERENLFVTDAGGWQPQTYVPAFIRRYPFVFSSADNGSTFTLCIDEEFEGCNQEGRGERLFDAEGQRTQYLQNMLGFLQAFQADFQRTRAFCARLKELGLLEGMRAQFTVGTQQPISLSGFQAVSRERLNALAGEQLEAFARSQQLEAIFGHLHSLRNFTAMAQRAAASGGKRETTVAAESSGPESKKASRKATAKKGASAT